MAQKSAVIIFNPSSGRPRSRAVALDRMVRLLSERGIDAVAKPTERPNHASLLAEAAVREGVEIVISYGGDGTVNEVLQGMIPGRAALAIWPGGTANVAAHDLKLPFNLERLAGVIAAGKTVRVAAGLATKEANHERALNDSVSPRGTPGDSRYFFMFAGIGLDASICRGVNPRLKKKSGQFAFWVSGLKHLFTWSGEPFSVEVDGATYESTFTLIGKGKSYGGGLRFTPHARLEDDWFEVFIVPPRRRNTRYLLDLACSIAGEPSRAGLTLVRGKSVRANSSFTPWVEADGELVGPLPMSFNVVPDALSVIIP
jgi:YegS/Rv2252/BmrU family lipid kinase